MISVKMKVVKISHGSILKLVRSIGQSDRLCLRYSGEALSITVILFSDQMEPPPSTVKISITLRFYHLMAPESKILFQSTWIPRKHIGTSYEEKSKLFELQQKFNLLKTENDNLKNQLEKESRKAGLSGHHKILPQNHVHGCVQIIGVGCLSPEKPDKVQETA